VFDAVEVPDKPFDIVMTVSPGPLHQKVTFTT
jgi:hypothetical protein